MLSPKVKVALPGDEYWITTFIFESYPIVNDWKEFELLELVRWYIGNSFCYYTQRDNPLSSVVLVRPCYDVATAQMYPRCFNRLGDVLYVELYVCLETKINLQDYLQVLSKHFVNKKYVAFGRDFRQTRIYPLTKLRK